VIVLDTSALVTTLVSRQPRPELVSRVASAGSLHSPHHIDVEFLSALRGLVLGGKLTVDRAADARQDFANLRLLRYPIRIVAHRAWEMRQSVSAYDACFLALAEVLDCPLVTCDRRMASASGHHAIIEVFTD
jgi:predicted nucleic acid-binding protein